MKVDKSNSRDSCSMISPNECLASLIRRCYWISGFDIFEFRCVSMDFDEFTTMYVDFVVFHCNVFLEIAMDLLVLKNHRDFSENIFLI